METMGKGLRMQQEVKMAHCKMKRERARMDSQKQRRGSERTGAVRSDRQGDGPQTGSQAGLPG